MSMEEAASMQDVSKLLERVHKTAAVPEERVAVTTYNRQLINNIHMNTQQQRKHR